MKMDNTAKDLLLLNSIAGFGYKKLQDLLAKFQNTTNIISSLPPAVFRIKDIEQELELIDKEKIDIITIFDKEYPDDLKQIHSPPIVLYVKGKLKDLGKNTIAVVGSRHCTYYGKAMTKRICSLFAKLEIVVVSGMARGIDTAAHTETLNSGGKTIAILGNGLKHIYPSENKKLFQTIASNGSLISEFPMNTPPLKENFPRRNRIISGLSKGVVVVEAPEQSGALITADFALEQDREVFAVPGNADSPSFKGCNNLIKQGAKLVDNAFDIIEELFPEILDKHTASVSPESENDKALSNIATEHKEIYQLLSNEPIDMDTLMEKLSLNSQQALSSLLYLELAGLVKQLPGKLFVKK